MQEPSEIVRRVVELRATRAIVLVAIDGLGGAGKTILAEHLSSALEASGLTSHVVHFDDFFLPSARRPRGTPAEKPIGGDFDWLRLRDDVLAPLRRGQAARYSRYDWASDAMAETKEVPSGGIVIVDGIYSSRRELASFYDLRVWVECPRALRLARGLERDGEEARMRWEQDWMPSEDRYVLEHRPNDRADVIVSGAAVVYTSESLLSQVDHLVYAAHDLESAVEDLERRLGVRASPGGQHPGRGTRNALLALGPASYLEIIAPDPAQPSPVTGRWLGVDNPLGPRLAAWAAKSTALDRRVADAKQRGVQLGPVRSGSRRRPDGVALHWQFTDPTTVVADGLVPFLIDWGASPHPAVTAVGGASLVGFRAEHPAAEHVRDLLFAVGIDLPVDPGPHPALIATLQTALGQVEIR